MNEPVWQPGQTLGPWERPDEFRLVEHIASGGEGELWKAVRQNRYGHEQFHAVKVLHSKFCATEEDLRAWTARWNDSFHDVLQIHHVRGLVRSDVVEGPQPHPEGRPAKDRGLYLIGAWANDASRLDDWARDCTASPAERLRVLVGLCEIVDDLHREGWVHRDISAGNVMVDSAGNVLLIDLTFLWRLNRAITVPIATAGYADAEAKGALPTTGKDRRAVGVLARVLLLPHQSIHPDEELSDVAAAAPGRLAGAGYSDAVIDCLMEVLGEQGGTRARPLTEWGRRLVDLVGAEPDRRQTCLAIAVDAHDRPVAVTGGDTGLRWYVSAGAEGSPADPLPAQPGGPRTARDLALVRDGLGRLVAAAVDDAGVLWAGTASDNDDNDDGGAWRPHLAEGARGVAALVSPRGETLLWTATPGGLALLTLSAEGYAPRGHTVPTAPGSRVLGATWDAHGLPAVLVTGADGVWHWTWPPGAAEPHRAQVCRVPAVDGSLALNRSWGELEAWVLGEDGVEYHLTRHHSGSAWVVLNDRTATGGCTTLHSVHQGIVRVHAGPAGVTLTMDSSAPRVEQDLDTGEAGPLALHQARDGAVQVAAVVDGEPRCWTESWSQDWVRVELRAL
ncbi:hypothetical protein [Streptomyces mangrovisoli]|uniref:Protein kinase domain-containing protein n=1 Tax=Streptomyces mangrovisoli TaxID=1428628 RepID=A0A1J4NQN7_9ACTN|nr:hypothetical protein [Streptomyces mangrovisoli]OIJ63557.1 hypothetical protein WN71_032515 [Streptomyces mangrovisoli]